MVANVAAELSEATSNHVAGPVPSNADISRKLGRRGTASPAAAKPLKRGRACAQDITEDRDKWLAGVWRRRSGSGEQWGRVWDVQRVAAASFALQRQGRANKHVSTHFAAVAAVADLLCSDASAQSVHQGLSDELQSVAECIAGARTKTAEDAVVGAAAAAAAGAAIAAGPKALALQLARAGASGRPAAAPEQRAGAEDRPAGGGVREGVPEQEQPATPLQQWLDGAAQAERNDAEFWRERWLSDMPADAAAALAEVAEWALRRAAQTAHASVPGSGSDRGGNEQPFDFTQVRMRRKFGSISIMLRSDRAHFAADPVKGFPYLSSILDVADALAITDAQKAQAAVLRALRSSSKTGKRASQARQRQADGATRSAAQAHRSAAAPQQAAIVGRKQADARLHRGGDVARGAAGGVERHAVLHEAGRQRELATV